MADVRSKAEGTSSAEGGWTILQPNYKGGCAITGSSSRLHNAGYCEDAFLGERAESYPYLRQCLRKTQSTNRVSFCDLESYKGQTDRCSKIKHGSSSDQRFLMVILNVDVYDVYRLVELAAAVKQIWEAMLEVIFQIKDSTLTIANSIVATFLTSDNDISNLLALLPSFRC